MATNLLAPNGFAIARPAVGMAPNYQGKIYLIKKGYLLNIGMGDVVKTLTSGDGNGGGQGYVGVATNADTAILGVFNGVAAYYDTVQQGYAYGLNGSYQAGSSPSADIPCYIYDDPLTTFKAQYNGGPLTGASWRGQNINFSGNGAPNSAGRSTASLTGLGTTSTLPFQVVALLGVAGGPQDPNLANPWMEVRMNTSEMLQPTGI